MRTKNELPDDELEAEREERRRDGFPDELEREMRRGNPSGLVFLEDGSPVTRRVNPDVETRIPSGDKRFTGDGRATPPSRAPQRQVVHIYSDVWERIVHECEKFQRLGRETGFVLIGAKSDKNSRRIFTVGVLIDAGPESEHHRGELQFDRNYQQKTLDKYRSVHPELGYLGSVHLHLSPDMTYPSGVSDSPAGIVSENTDYGNALKSLRGKDSIAEFVEGILVFEHGIPKVHFYYISRQDPRYCPIDDKILREPSPYPQDMQTGDKLPWFLRPLRVNKTRLGLELDLLRAEGFEPKIVAADCGESSFLMLNFERGNTCCVFLLPSDYPVQRPLILYISGRSRFRSFSPSDLGYSWSKQSYLVNLLRPLESVDSLYELQEKLLTILRGFLYAIRNIGRFLLRKIEISHKSYPSIIGRKK